MSESVQWALLVPSLIAVVLGGVQVGLTAHANNVAHHAAAAGAESGAISGSSGQARDVALRIARAGSLDRPTVAVSSTGALIKVTVTGRAFSLLPGGGAASATVTYPKEPR